MRIALPFVLAAFTLTACAGEEEGEIPLYPPRTREDAQPIWLWLGRKQDVPPPCIEERPTKWVGWTDVTAPPECGQCTCDPAACALPTKVAAQTPICADGEGTPILFDAGDGWKGGCTDPRASIPPDSFAAVIYDPPRLAPCAPSQALEPPPIDGTIARACEAWKDGEKDPDGESFCINPEADGKCRPAFPVRRVVNDFGSDHRTCSPCECASPSGGRCTAQVTLYGDPTCTGQLDSSTLSDTDKPLCHDIGSAARLAAFRAEIVEEVPGTCAPIRNQSFVRGVIERKEQHVVCCDD